MRSLLAPLAVLAALAGCQSAAAPYLSASEPGTRIERVEVPDGYTVRTASFGVSYATSVSGDSSSVSGSASERPYVNVFAVEDATGEEVLLVYALGARREPVLIVRLGGGSGAAAQRRAPPR